MLAVVLIIVLFIGCVALGDAEMMAAAMFVIAVALLASGGMYLVLHL